MGSIARNFDVGMLIQQDGMNILSARAYDARPDLFEKRDDILINPASQRKLVLYLRITEPIYFDFYPATEPHVAQDQFFVRAKIGFTLTDVLPDGSGLGLITRIDATIEAVAGLDRNGPVIVPTIVSLQVVDLVPDSPFPPKLNPSGALDVGGSIAGVQPAAGVGTPLPASDAFVAILNYLISVFLLKGMQRAVQEAPLPQLALIPSTGLNLYLRGLSVENKRMTAYLLDADGGLVPATAGSPPVANPPHLSVGAVQSVLHQVLNSVLPISMDIPAADCDTGFFRMRASTLTIPSADFELSPPNQITAHVYLQGSINFSLNAVILGYHIQVDLGVPLGWPTQAYGQFSAFTRDDGDGTIELRVKPTGGFFEPRYVIIATDWRDSFRNAVKQWVENNVSPILRWIPFFGWLISKGVEEIAGDVAYALGAVLDAQASVFLTTIGTVAFYVISTKWLRDDVSFKVYGLDTNKAIAGVPLGIKNLSDPRIDPNGGGELILDAWLLPESTPSPLPAPQIPSPEPPPAVPPPLPCQPAPPTPAPMLPAYPDSAFQPALLLNALAWQDSQTLVYDVEIDQPDGTKIFQVRRAQFHLQTSPSQWHLTLTTEQTNGALVSTVDMFFSPAFLLLNETSSQTFAGANGVTQTITQVTTFDMANRTLAVTAQVGSQTIGPQTFPMPQGAIMVGSAESWMFQLMAADLKTDGSGNFARSEIELGQNADNWTRFVPTVLRVMGVDTLSLGGQNIDALAISVADEEFGGTVWIEQSAARRLLLYKQTMAQSAGNFAVTMQVRI
jgi:hypothetical protein